MRISDWSSDVCSSDLRPCLQYQIKRCSAPCVGMIEPERYRSDVQQAIMFLEGRSQALLRESIKKMERASDQQDYEARSEERRVGKEGVSTCRSRWSQDH